jgi:hypothetical protein
VPNDIASEQNPVNGDCIGPTGVYETADPITTNQKVAGSSPAEHALEISRSAGVLTLLSNAFESLYRPYEALAQFKTSLVNLGVADLCCCFFRLYGVYAGYAVFVVHGNLEHR